MRSRNGGPWRWKETPIFGGEHFRYGFPIDDSRSRLSKHLEAFVPDDTVALLGSYLKGYADVEAGVTFMNLLR